MENGRGSECVRNLARGGRQLTEYLLLKSVICSGASHTRDWTLCLFRSHVASMFKERSSFKQLQDISNISYSEFLILNQTWFVHIHYKKKKPFTLSSYMAQQTYFISIWYLSHSHITYSYDTRKSGWIQKFKLYITQKQLWKLENMPTSCFSPLAS
jgi:hypothetical protein